MSVKMGALDFDENSALKEPPSMLPRPPFSTLAQKQSATEAIVLLEWNK
jgi:hypothetical protein